MNDPAPSLKVSLERFHTWHSCGFSEHRTVNPALKLNWKTELEFKHATPHDAKRVLAGRPSLFVSAFVNIMFSCMLLFGSQKT